MSLSVGVLRGAGHGRGVVDHRLARQHLVNEYRRKRLSREQVCDAHPELIRAAKNVGTEATTPCPICAADDLRLVTYVFGPRLPAFGRCITTKAELRALAKRPGTFTCYVVEVCTGCYWNHLAQQIPLGRRHVG